MEGGGQGQQGAGTLPAVPATSTSGGCCSAGGGDSPMPMTNCFSDMLLVERRGTPERQMNGALGNGGGCVHNNNNNNSAVASATAPTTALITATTTASASTSTFPMEASTQTHNLLLENGGGSNFEEHCSVSDFFLFGRGLDEDKRARFSK